MDAVLPAFVDRLLDQGRDPGEIPEIPVADATGWLTPLAARLLSLMEHGMPCAPSRAFLAHGFAYLPLPAHDGRGLYLRLAHGSVMTAWPIASTSVVLTLMGTLDLEMYQKPEDVQACNPQYVRSFGPEQVFAAHAGTLCGVKSSPSGAQVLAVRQYEAGPAGPLSLSEHADVAQRALRTLERVLDAGTGAAL
ncbi:hypothetical protein [Streptomyces sp. BA2]|uniref:hypothetical protein n=1 Tax=Streptomyces sp. BA2 TaxID=436595 RepID=UPI00132A3052|nr:hypothetical protein [Streptomyces sp. BA2]MWA07686.1 hypothetical protein [Streptomyces sp. BA2]